MEVQRSKRDEVLAQLMGRGMTKSDLAAASSFADCCYDRSRRMPARAAMGRLVELGVVEKLVDGVWAETRVLRQLGY